VASSVRTSNLVRSLVACSALLLAETALANDGNLSVLLPSLQQGGYVWCYDTALPMRSKAISIR
jgi:hypothetical protein